MPVAFLDFSQFLPGGSRYGGGLAQADNVIPAEGGLRPLYSRSFASLAAVASATPAYGAYAHAYPSGGGSTSYLGDALTHFVGTKTALYEVSAATFNAKSKGGGYAVAVGAEPGFWRFASVGNDIWACNGFDEWQRRTNNAGNFADGVASTFKPKPRFSGVVKEFLIGCDLSANAGRFADEFCWSDVDDATWFDPADATRPTSVSGAKRLVSRAGQITGFIGGEYGRIFKRNAIYALQFTGGADVWRIDMISPGVGCGYPGSLIEGPDGAAYFFSGTRFYRQAGLSAPEPISTPGLEQLIVDGQHFPTRALVHGAISTMAQEDGVMQAACLARPSLYLVTWANSLLQATADTFWRHPCGAAYDVSRGAWSMVYDTTYQNTCIGSMPFTLRATQNDFSLDGAFGYMYDGSTIRQYQFLGPGTQAATLKARRQPVVLDGAERPPVAVQIKGAMPLFTNPDAAAFSATPTAPTPPNVSIKVEAAGDPLFQVKTDEDGATVSPRSETQSKTDNADEWLWYPVQAEGCWFDVTVTIPSEGGWTHFGGVYLWYDVVQ